MRRRNRSRQLKRDTTITYDADSVSAPYGRRYYVMLIYVWFVILHARGHRILIALL